MEQELNNDELKKLIEALLKRNIKIKCAMCKNKNLSFCKYDFINKISKTGDGSTDISFIPCVTIICNNCGNFRQNILKYLDLDF